MLAVEGSALRRVEDGEAVDPGHHHVEHDGVEPVGHRPRALERLFARAGLDAREPGLGEPLHDEHPERVVVVDDEHARPASTLDARSPDGSSALSRASSHHCRRQVYRSFGAPVSEVPPRSFDPASGAAGRAGGGAAPSLRRPSRRHDERRRRKPPRAPTTSP